MEWIGAANFMFVGPATQYRKIQITLETDISMVAIFRCFYLINTIFIDNQRGILFAIYYDAAINFTYAFKNNSSISKELFFFIYSSPFSIYYSWYMLLTSIAVSINKTSYVQNYYSRINGSYWCAVATKFIIMDLNFRKY